MSFKPYSSSVLVGNWYEDVQLEQDTMKNFLEKRANGQLLTQQSTSVVGLANQPADVSTTSDGFVHFGQKVMLVNCGGNGIPAVALSRWMPLGSGDDDLLASATTGLQQSARTIFMVESLDASKPGDLLTYGQQFTICTLDKQWFLSSDFASFQRCSKKTRHNPVLFSRQPSNLIRWQVTSFDPNMRVEAEGTPVKANTVVYLTHCKTNQNLNLEPATTWSPFGREYEVSTLTCRDSHKAEMPSNQWKFVMNAPGTDFFQALS